MANTIGEKELKRKYPVTSGLGADDKHEGRRINLVAQEKSLVSKREKIGL